MATIDGDADLSEKADDAQIIAADENTETGTIESHKLVVLAGEVSEDEAPESAFDLVAVHGLFEDSQETWTPADETKTWLEANLYETYTNARIMTFGYETDESKDGISTRGSIRKKALQMLEELLELRKELKPNVFRPLIFVAHDIGGIIVKEAICIAAQDYAKWSTIVHSTRLLFFVGTPHRAETKWEMEDKLGNFLYTNSEYIPSLAIDRIKELSRSITEINDAFVACEIPTIAKIVNIRSDVEDVDEQGFDMYTCTMLLPFEENLSLPKGHKEIAKEIAFDDFYALINEALAGYPPPSSSNDESTRCLQTLQAQAVPLYPLIASSEKFSWIKEDKIYLDFFEVKKPRLLQIHGGYDEISQASEYIYLHLEESAPSGLDRQENEILLGFNFDAHDDGRNTIAAMLTTFLAQMYCHNKELYEGGSLQFEQMCLYRSWTLPELILIFRLALTNSGHRGILCVVNNLGACNESQCIEFLRSMSDLAKNTERPFKMVFSSVSGSHIQSELGDWPQIDLSKAPVVEEIPDGTVADVVDDNILILLQEKPALAQFETKIREKLVKYGNDERLRTLVLDEIRRLDTTRTKAEIRDDLDSFNPTTPEELFTWILDKVPTERRHWARKAISWIMFSLIPLSASQLGEALAFSTDGTSLDEETMPADIESALENTFRGLFFVGQYGICVEHNSLTDFFLDGHQEESWYDVKASAHQEITTACLSYIMLPQGQKWIRKKLDSYPLDLVETPIFETRESLLEYAITYWPKHYSLIPETSRPIGHVLELAEKTEAMCTWSEAHWLYSNPITRRDRSFCSPLPVFAGLGLEDVVERLFATSEEHRKDSGLALIEAVRNRHAHIVSTLLCREKYDQECLQEALTVAASHCHSHILTDLINFADENYKDFKWPGRLIYRVSQFGHTHILRKLLKVGATIKDAETLHGMTPLHVAAREGHSETTKVLIENGADIMAKAKFGRIPLQTASVYGHPNVVKVLIKAKVEVNYLDEFKDNALDLATHWGNFQVIEALVEGNIEIDRRDKEGDFIPLTTTAFFGFKKCSEILLKHAASTEVYGVDRWTPLRYTTSKNNVEVTRLFLENGADPNTTEGGEPLLGDCAAENYLEIVKLLVENGAKIDTGSSEGWSALQRSCQGGHIEVATYLLDHGAEVNHRSKTGQTAIIIAANNSHPELVRLLIDRGGDVDFATEAGWTAIHLSYDSPDTTRVLLEKGANINRVQNLYTPLFLAAANNHIETVETLLEFEADTEIVYANEDWQKNFSPLTIAVTCGYENVVRLLLEADANINHSSENGCTPVTYAVKGIQEEVLRVLLEYHPDLEMRDSDGATALNCMDKSTPLSFVKRLVNAGSNIESRDNDGYTPLCNAVMCEDIDIVKYLVKKKAKLEVTGNLFGSPLHIACRRVLTDIAKFLVEAKADVNQVQPTIMGTPLQAVARCWTSRKGEDQEKLIRYLVEEGKADVRVVGGLLGCALNAMCGWASAEMVKYLLGKGAKVDVPDSQGRVATHYAAVQSVHHFTPLINAEADIELKDKMERSTLHWAALGGRLDVVERVLYLSRSLVDQPDVDGWTPLLWAARQCGTEHNVGTVSAQKQIINFLIGQGADPCVVGKTLDGREWTTVKVARYHGVDEEVIELLIEKIKEKLENEGSADTWDDAVHASAKAQVHTGSCDSCLSALYGIHYMCQTCLDFAYCYKCYTSRHLFHPDHEFKATGEEYENIVEVTAPESEEDEDTDDDTDDDDSHEEQKRQSSEDGASKEVKEATTNGTMEDSEDSDDSDDDDSD